MIGKILNNTVPLVLVSQALGCSIKPELIKPVEFNTHNSYAYNIANQTALTKESSPLRDFSKKEVLEAKAKLTEKNPGDEPIFTGTILALTGSLIDIIDIAGGAMANLAEQPHESSKSRWIIVVPKEKFKNQTQTKQYIFNTINNAALKAFGSYGVVSSDISNANRSLSLTYVTTGKGHYPIGLVRPKDITNTGDLYQTSFPFNGKNTKVYTYGFRRDDRQIKNLLITAPTPAFLSDEYKNISLTDFNKNITSYLPYGFFLYTPSFPKFSGNGRNFTYLGEVVPAIYSQGNKYEFIQPILEE